MDNNEEKAKTGRPRIDIDWDEFDKLCAMQATLNEIAAWFKCSIDTIENRCWEEKEMRFSDYFAKKASIGKISLRRKQFQTAMSGNVSMLIWLGKNWLDQKDKQETEVTGDAIKIIIDKDDEKL